MIIDTNDDRRLEAVKTPTGLLYMEIMGPHGSEETILLTAQEVRGLQEFLIEEFGEVYD